jgi:hypothetical protein
MRKLSLAAVALACAFAVAACSTSQETTALNDLQAVSVALNATAADLPTACANLSAAVNQVASTPNLPGSIASALSDGNSKYSGYCSAAAGAAVAASVAVSDINTFIQALKQQLATQAAAPTAAN